MIDQYFLVLTTIDLFVLTFMCILTKLSETLNGKQKRGFFLAFVLIGAISILEVITILVDGAPVHLRWLNILSNYLGFGLSPAVSLCLVYVLDKKQGVRRGFKTAVACEALLREEFDPDTDACAIGDIVISMDHVRAQAAEYGHSERRECGYLLTHGLFHLMGYDHMTDEDKPVMRAMEEKALASIGLTREE